MTYASHQAGQNPMPIDESINKRMVLVIDIPTAQAIEQLAKRDRRSVSNYVRNVLQDHVKTQAVEPVGEPAADGRPDELTTDQHVYSQIIAAAVEQLKKTNHSSPPPSGDPDDPLGLKAAVINAKTAYVKNNAKSKAPAE